MAALPLAGGTTAEVVDADGVSCILCSRTNGADDPWLVYFHGGGYRIGSAIGYRAHGSHLAAAMHTRVLLVDYRLAPENPFPAAVDDALNAYSWVLSSGVDSSRIALGGDSAGGGLTVATLLAARTNHVALPAAALCLSPWADLTNAGETFKTMADIDRLFSLEAATEAAGLYLQGHNPRDPLASPMFADLTGMPPMLVLVGGAESLLDDALRLTARANECGVDVTLAKYEDMPHVWQLNYPAYPEAVQAVEQMGAFINQHTS